MLALGFRSVARVMAYRVALKLRLHPVLNLPQRKVSGPFFHLPAGRGTAAATGGWDREARLFGWKAVPITDQPPDWFVNHFNGVKAAGTSSPWHQLPDFDPTLGDIKTIWEWSRFEFALPAALRNDHASIARLNAWLADWCDANPPYRGPNWKCGQEASLRTLRLLMALLVTGRLDSPESGLSKLIELHLRRIAPTTSYARGQDNNHGTSEAAALFAGGAWLQATTGDGHRWARKGRAMLEERVAALVGEDGGFSQYSTTYHRLLLDTLSVAEVLRARLGEPEFTRNFYHRTAAATRWLYTLTAPETGDTPNLGQNDSSELLATGWTTNRDFRPSVELASRLFCQASAFDEDHGASALADRLGVPIPATKLAPAQSTVFADYGLAVLIRGGSRATLNFPHFRFRPSQADLLHVDYWRDGRPLLRDAGTYSYAADLATLDAYSSVAAHNTIQFDNSDQMPRLGRFLYGDWPRTQLIEPLAEGDATSIAAAYDNRAGHRHARRIELRDDSLLVCDTVSGFARSAIARWRLPEGDWRIAEGRAVTPAGHRVSVSADNGVVPVLTLGPGVEARHYLQAESSIVLSILVERPCNFETVFELGEEHERMAQRNIDFEDG